MCIHNISLRDALKGTPVVFNHLDGRVLNISMDEIISPDTVKLAKNERIPIIDETRPIESITLEKRWFVF